MLLDRDGIRTALIALDVELGRSGVRGELFGAAMALAYDARRATVDVDATFLPASEVRKAAQRVADDLGLEPDWLNDGAKAFMPGNDPNQVSVFEGNNLSVAAASPRYLLAMKLLAARVDRDQDDIRALYELCGFTSAEEGLRLLETTYPSYVIAPRAQFLLQEMFPSRDRGSPGLGR
jgi:hypothetical protein